MGAGVTQGRPVDGNGVGGLEAGGRELYKLERSKETPPCQTTAMRDEPALVWAYMCAADREGGEDRGGSESRAKESQARLRPAAFFSASAFNPQRQTRREKERPRVHLPTSWEDAAHNN